MRKIIGSLLLFAVITISAISCGGDIPAEAPKDGEKKECCSDKEKCEHKKPEACAADCTKSCCASKEGKKSCEKDSATCAGYKAKCNTECGTDSVLCAAHTAECKAACIAKSDTNLINGCPADCIKPCCNNKVEKTACPADCKKECCTEK